jgi:hypothetical protein
MFASTINLAIFIMMVIIYLNEMKNISGFIFNFNYIKDLSRIIMNEKCNSVYCEAETDRYQIAKNSYKLLLPNDIFNSKTYIIFTFIISIMIYIYFYLTLFNASESDSNYYVLNFLLLSLLLGIIIYRYVPNDEEGYLNYFGKIKDPNSFYGIFKMYVFVLLIAITFVIFKIKRKQISGSSSSGEDDDEGSGSSSGGDGLFITFVKYICFIFAIILVFNLMNIVMSFRNNTTPILKTKNLIWSLKHSFKSLNDKFSLADKATLNAKVHNEYEIIAFWMPKVLMDKKVLNTTTILSAINILIAFEELSKIVLGGYGNADADNNINIKYILGLQKTIKEDYEKISSTTTTSEGEGGDPPTVSDLALIYDRMVKIPHHYDEEEHSTNNNSNNTDYVYTADISYDNANLFYEKYWNLNSGTGDASDAFIYDYDYFVPSYLFGGYRPNLFKILIIIIIFIVFVYILGAFCGVALMKIRTSIKLTELFSQLYTILYPLFLLVILITYILLFIRFNTMFNSSVVYKCLDSSYKRSLNKLNNVVVPYIRMYDNKIIKGNKNYLQHYIITNVFYSILSGNIKLCHLEGTTAATKTIINEPAENENYYDIPRIKSTRLKMTNMNNSILSNDNEFREYYKAKFETLYKDGYSKKEADSIYEVFRHLFRCDKPDAILKSETDIDDYFKSIINSGNILKIYLIIKKCFVLFNEETFNNNLIYYNNHENKQKGVNIDAYNKFKFYKYGDKVIPYKFILKLNTFAEFTEFVKDDVAKVAGEFNKNIIDHFDISIPATDVPLATQIPLTSILEDYDNGEEELSTQAADIEKKKDKNIIKLIAMYLLILGHINYNRIEFVSGAAAAAGKKEIYEKKTTYLYKLISNILYDDTYDIDDTFNATGGASANSNAIVSIAITKDKEGTGYTSPPTITITPVGGTGTGATAEAVLKPTFIESIPVSGGTATYTSAPKIAIRNGGAKEDAKAIAKLNAEGKIESIEILKSGSGYTKVPTVVIESVSGSDSLSVAPTAVAVLKPTSVASIQITNAGTGYTTIPTVAITDGGGSGAEAKAFNTLLIGDGIYEKYKHLTYIYNYLESRYVNISANNNNNYLANIIKGINNKLNDDDKILNTESKSARYMFSDDINLMKTPKEYDNEDEILNVANNVSTSSLAATYVFNIILIVVYFNVISANIK